MPSPKHSGKVRVTLNGVDLDLEFLSYNLMVLTEVAGVQSPFEVFARFEGLSMDDVKKGLYASTDMAFLTNVMVAGLASHPQYENTTPKVLKRKLWKLVDAEAAKAGISPMQVVAKLNNEIFPAVLGSLNIGSDDDSKNAEAPEAKQAAGE